MSKINEAERRTQERVLKLFTDAGLAMLTMATYVTG